MADQPFRFLDLPAEIRLLVYENIDFPTIWHSLDRRQTGCIYRYRWNEPPIAQVYESRIILIKPCAPLGILETCRLISKEASPILHRKWQYCKVQPIRYLVDYSAACALIDPGSPLQGCLTLTGGTNSGLGRKVAVNFIRLCLSHLIRTVDAQNQQDPTTDTPLTIEMTITHEPGIVYGRELVDLALSLRKLEPKFDERARLVVIYKVPMPNSQMSQLYSMGVTQQVVDHHLEKIPRDTGKDEQGRQECGVFVRPLEKKAFQEHEKGLEWY